MREGDGIGVPVENGDGKEKIRSWTQCKEIPEKQYIGEVRISGVQVGHQRSAGFSRNSLKTAGLRESRTANRTLQAKGTTLLRKPWVKKRQNGKTFK